MATMGATVLVVLACLCTPTLAGHDWSYDGQYGISHWAEMGFSNCQKQRQSPIAIETDSAIRRLYKPMEFYHFDKIPTAMNLTNNFHSAGAFMTTPGEAPYISSGGLPGDFEVIGFHFHWAEDDAKGSEHLINGRSYPLEMHVVCKNKKYEAMKGALNNTDGLAVLSVMFEVSQTNNRAIGRLEDALSEISVGGSTAMVEDPPRLLELMPWNTNDFFRYDGSLTTPSCNEVVTWTIFLETVKATEEELNLFRQLKGHENKPIGHNYRATQRSHGRQVYLCWPETDDRVAYELGESRPESQPRGGDGGGAGATHPSLLTAVLMLLALVALSR